jgi:hypothetical protein
MKYVSSCKGKVVFTYAIAPATSTLDCVKVAIRRWGQTFHVCRIAWSLSEHDRGKEVRPTFWDPKTTNVIEAPDGRK